MTRIGRGIRLFRCQWCGHRLRLGNSSCGKCYQPTPYYNRLPVWLAGLAVVSWLGLEAVRRIAPWG